MDKLKIKEICIKLDLRIDIINEVYLYVENFRDCNTHNFNDVVILAACIYLSSKINEDIKRIRGISSDFYLLDIINVIYFVKSKYEKITQLEDTYKNSNSIPIQDKILLKNLKEDTYKDDKNLTLINTTYDLTIENVSLITLVLHT
jgi:hypothetical protein